MFGGKLIFSADFFYCCFIVWEPVRGGGGVSAEIVNSEELGCGSGLVMTMQGIFSCICWVTGL